MEEDTPLEGKEKEDAIKLLKRTKFEDFEIHPHYYNRFGNPRHGITIEKAKEIYNQFNKILLVFKRQAILGYKYTFVYRLSNKQSYFLLFLLDEKPLKIFNAFYSGPNVEKRLMRKFGLY